MCSVATPLTCRASMLVKRDSMLLKRLSMLLKRLSMLLKRLLILTDLVGGSEDETVVVVEDVVGAVAGVGDNGDGVDDIGVVLLVVVLAASWACFHFLYSGLILAMPFCEMNFRGAPVDGSVVEVVVVAPTMWAAQMCNFP